MQKQRDTMRHRETQRDTHRDPEEQRDNRHAPASVAGEPMGRVGHGSEWSTDASISPAIDPGVKRLRTEQRWLIAGRQQHVAHEQSTREQRALFDEQQQQTRDYARERFEEERDKELNELRAKEKAKEAQKTQQEQKLRQAAGAAHVGVKKRSYSSFADDSGGGSTDSASSYRLGLGMPAAFDAAQAWTLGPWLTLLRDAQAPPFGRDRLASCAQHVRRYAQQIGRVDRLLVVIADVDRGSSHAIGATDARVTLVDPTGTVYGTINKKLLEPNVGSLAAAGVRSLAGQIVVGAALELRNVSLISPVSGKFYLNIAQLDNVPRVVSANTPAPVGSGDSNGVDHEEDADPRAAYDPTMLQEATGERQRQHAQHHGAVGANARLGVTVQSTGPDVGGPRMLHRTQLNADGGCNPPSALSSARAAAPYRNPRPSSSSLGPALDSAGSAAKPTSQSAAAHNQKTSNIPDSRASSSCGGWGTRPAVTGQAWGGGGAGATPSIQRLLPAAGGGWGGASADGIGFGSVATAQSSMRSPASGGFTATTPARPGTGTGMGDGSAISNSSSGGTGWGQRPQQSPGAGSWGQRGSQPLVAWQGCAGANLAGATPRNARSSQHAVTPVPSPTFSQPTLASSSTATTLTAEQKARVEANKARAMELRQKRLAAQAAGQQRPISGGGGQA